MFTICRRLQRPTHPVGAHPGLLVQKKGLLAETSETPETPLPRETRLDHRYSYRTTLRRLPDPCRRWVGRRRRGRTRAVDKEPNGPTCLVLNREGVVVHFGRTVGVGAQIWESTRQFLPLSTFGPGVWIPRLQERSLSDTGDPRLREAERGLLSKKGKESTGMGPPGTDVVDEERERIPLSQTSRLDGYLTVPAA